MIAQTSPPAETGLRDLPHQSVGYLLNRFGVLFLVGVFLLAVWLHHVATAVLLAVVLSAAGLAKTWGRVSLWRVTVGRTLSGSRVFPGESVHVALRVVNRKPLPLPWAHIETEVPVHLVPDPDPEPGQGSSPRTLSRTIALPWYSALTCRWRLRCERRGYYPLGPIRVTAADIFGFYPRSAQALSADEIIVYPRIFPLAQLAMPSQHPMGETRAERRILGDPTRTLGIRDYRPEDSLRRIHWKASARHQQLQVKVFEPTASVRMALFLAMESFQRNGVWDEDGLELGISTAASLAHDLIGRSCPVGLFVNTRLADSGQPVSIRAGASIDHEATILEALAKVTPRVNGPFEQCMEDESRTLPWGTTLGLVAARPSEPLVGLVERLKSRGYRFLLVRVDSSEDAGPDGADSWHCISPVDVPLEVRLG